MARVAIIGLGLIGGSLGLAIKKARRRDIEVVGFDEYRRAQKRAAKLKAVDSTARSPQQAVRGAGLVIIATPPAAMESVFKEIAPALARGAAVTDVASTKSQIMQWAAEHLPSHVSFVGGHPMAGKTEQGVENAEADLFRDRPYAVVPGEGANEGAVRSVLGLVQTVGAQERFMTATEHDHYAAAVSHLPLGVSLALFTLLRKSESWPDFAKMAGPAYTDLTRLVSGNPQMNTDIAVTNRADIQYWIDRYILELQRVRDLFDGPEEDIFREFAYGQINRERFLSGEDFDQRTGPELPDSTSQMASLMMGPKIYERVREMTKFAEEKAREAGRRR